MKKNDLKKTAVISDIHGNIAALEVVANDIKKREVDCVLNLGDHISGPLWPKETIEFLMTQEWIQIAGNHDRNLVNQNPDDHNLSDQYAYKLLNPNEKEWLKTLPSNLEPQNEMFLFHGAPSNDKTYLLETIENGRTRLATHKEIRRRLGEVNSRMLLCGHTHIPRVVALPGDKLIVNPGSVGLQAYDDNLPEVHVMETGSPHARYAILEYQNNNWSVEIISLLYDYKIAAKQAMKNDRPDWEIGLRSGYMNV